MKEKIIFKEEQHFLNTWLFYLVLGCVTLAIAGMIIPIWIQRDTIESIAFPVVPLLIILAIILFFIRSKLYTIIDESAIYYRFPPFINYEKKLTKSDISELYVRKYKPIWEYGGWGYRIRFGKGKALNVSGNQGLQIVLSNGKGLLIGTQKPEQMRRVIKRLKENWGMGHG